MKIFFPPCFMAIFFLCTFPLVLCHLLLYFQIFVTFFHAFQRSSLTKIIEDAAMQFTGLRLEYGVLFLAQPQTYRQILFLSFSACFHFLHGAGSIQCCTELLCPGDQKRDMNKCTTYHTPKLNTRFTFQERHEREAKLVRNCLAI